MQINRRSLLTALSSALCLPHVAFAGIFDSLSRSADVIVIGAGAAGLAAAVEAAEAGAQVIVLEKQKEIGGNTLISGGFYAAVDPERQKQQHIDDSFDFFYWQTFEYGGRQAKPELVRHLVDNATDGLVWLEKLGMRFEPNVFELYGTHWQRTHIPVLPLGAGYIRTLSLAAMNRGVKIITERPVVDIVFENGKATGVVAQNGANKVTYKARRAVIIASGSFAVNNELITRYAPQLAGLTTNNTPASTGDVMLAAHRHGAAIRDMQYIQCLPGCPPGKKYRVRFHNDVSRFIFVDHQGKRFIREDEARDKLRDAVLNLPEKYGFSIVDGNGFAEAGILTQKEVILAIEGGEAWKGNSIVELAKKMGLPPDNLQATIDDYNRAVRDKNDRFGKSARELRHFIDQPPFYASYAGMTIHYTEGGLDINTKAQCLDKQGNIIAGLYAAGAVTGGVHGKNRLGGNGLADAIVFGRTAGKNAAQENAR